ncbi:MerR family transcriptional regulator [Loigolactobacillus jiayinensis]|uniref:MerR family transcriptional regulator n=1 Tax=Loigolactobacillus jiayinensis TaxID=2486016 RepID=A0ABW1RAD4_9LACO|nr:MerR family transcriptional regulator [Loigolactobacillus jiayinensis]
MSLQKKLGIDIDRLIFGISQISQMTAISPRQLRYWEKRGYISSLPEKEGASRQYNLKMTIRIIGIKQFLDEGYTLATAVQKVADFAQRNGLMRQFITQRFEGTTELAGEMALDFGDLADGQRIYGVVHEGRAEFKIQAKA